MFASAFRWLLVIALVLNGTAAPQATASDPMSGELQATAMPSDCAMHAKSRTDVADVSMTGDRSLRAGDASTDDAPSDASADSCCDGAGCDCGCLQAPLLHSGVLMLSASLVATTVSTVGDASPGRELRGPPLRPPSA
jgi:hypothetical protein